VTDSGESSIPHDDHVRLSIPARHEYARIARIGVAALALRLGFSYREIEDLRLAIDEALIFLLGGDRPHERVTIRYGTETGVVTLTATASFSTEADDSARDRFETLISDLVDSWDTDEAAGRVTFTKRHRSADEV
jgi:anti-sigma regulatory factor (Ser/Thr protein kinase)